MSAAASRLRCAPLSLSAALLAAACAAGPAADSTGPPLQPAQLERLAAAEKLYRALDPAFAAERDKLAGDPATAYWLTRVLVFDIVRGLDRQSMEEAFAASVAHEPPPALAIPLEHLTALGAAAAPALIEDLLQAPQAKWRVLGRELLRRIGQPVVPVLARYLDDPDWRLRGDIMRVAAALDPTPAAVALLQHGADDPKFQVRAIAYPALVRLGDPYLDAAWAALATDSDPYVRLVIARELGQYADLPTAKALVAYYGACMRRGDVRGVQAADASLRRISGYHSARDLAFWKTWLRSYRGPGGGAR